MKPHVIAFSLHPGDLIGPEDANVRPGTNHEAAATASPRGSAGTELIEQRDELAGTTYQVVLAEIPARAFECDGKFPLLQRLQQIVDGVDSKRVERVLFVGRQENHGGH